MHLMSMAYSLLVLFGIYQVIYEIETVLKSSTIKNGLKNLSSKKTIEKNIKLRARFFQPN